MIPALYLIPTVLGEESLLSEIPPLNREIISRLRDFIVEDEKTARRHLKKLSPGIPQPELIMQVLDKHHPENLKPAQMLMPLKQGKPMGLLSEAGCPAIADPGALLVREAHRLGLRVIPLVGPSSLLLALMASGFNGQRFSFEGYLPVKPDERKKVLKALEKQSRKEDRTFLFIETPFRNEALLQDMLEVLGAETRILVAADLTLPEEYIAVGTPAQLRDKALKLHKRPVVFGLMAD